LIRSVAQAAAGAAKLYWLTQANNAGARALYDRVGRDTGFVKYELASLDRAGGSDPLEQRSAGTRQADGRSE
jgi:hypothetical protein